MNQDEIIEQSKKIVAKADKQAQRSMKRLRKLLK